MAASLALSSGTIRREIFLLRASIAMGSAPRTPRTPPSSDNSPTKRQSGTSFLLSPPYAPRETLIRCCLSTASIDKVIWHELFQSAEDTGDDDGIRAVHKEDAAGDVSGRD